MTSSCERAVAGLLDILRVMVVPETGQVVPSGMETGILSLGFGSIE